MLLNRDILQLNRSLRRHDLIRLVGDHSRQRAPCGLKSGARLSRVFQLSFLRHLTSLLTRLLATRFNVRASTTTHKAILSSPLRANRDTTTSRRSITHVSLRRLLLQILAATLQQCQNGNTLSRLRRNLLRALTKGITDSKKIIQFPKGLISLISMSSTRLNLLRVMVTLLRRFLSSILSVLTRMTHFHRHNHVNSNRQRIRRAYRNLNRRNLTQTN